jgi:hypothetical protein
MQLNIQTIMIVTKDNIRTLPIHNAKPKKMKGASISPEELQRLQVSILICWVSVNFD